MFAVNFQFKIAYQFGFQFKIQNSKFKIQNCFSVFVGKLRTHQVVAPFLVLPQLEVVDTLPPITD